MFLLTLFFLSLSSQAFSTDYTLIDFLENQREIIPQSHLKMKIESDHRVDFQKLSCLYNHGIFTDYLWPEGQDSLVILEDQKSQVQKVIRYLKNNSPNAVKLFDRLERSPHKIYIKASKSRNFLNLVVFGDYEHNNAYGTTILEKSSLNLEDDRVPLNKLGASSIVVWNPSTAKTLKGKAIALAHELYHAYDASRGMLDYRLVSGPGYESTAVTEYRGVFFENLVRKDLGLKPRIKYSPNSEGTLKNLWVDRPCLKE